MSRTPGWSWKAREREANPRLRLAYEPGNWGDMLKALWAVPLARALGEAPLQLLDPFAGAPTWPLMPTAKERLARLPDGVRAALAPYAVSDAWPSTGRLLLDLGPNGSEAQVYDLDDTRREAWLADARAHVLVAEDGQAALGLSPPRPGRLTLLDPYDLFETFETVLPASLAHASTGPWLAYLYNKAPRSAAQFKRYETLRGQLEAWRQRQSGVGLLVGRLPADPRLPRAWHEVLLLAPDALIEDVRGEVTESTRALASELAAEEAVEHQPGVS